MSNSTNNRWLFVITLLLLTANMVTLALLWTNKKAGKENFNQPPPQQQLGGQVFEFLTRELKLDSAQQETYKKLRNQHRLQVSPFQDSIGKAKDNFFALLPQENVSDSMIEAYSKKIGDLEQQRDVCTFRHFQKLRAICNKKQQIKFDSIIQETMHRMAPAKNQGPPQPERERPAGERRDDRDFRKPGMRHDENRPPPSDGMSTPGDRPPHHPGMRPGDEATRPGMRPRGDRPPPGMRPEGPPRKDTI